MCIAAPRRWRRDCASLDLRSCRGVLRHRDGGYRRQSSTLSSPARCGENINLRIGDGHARHRAATKPRRRIFVEAVWRAFGGPAGLCGHRSRPPAMRCRLSERASAFLTHPVFHVHRSETELLRYMRKLADRDLALDRAMIPLGSCTMKLNATSEMIPLTWPEFCSSASVCAARAASPAITCCSSGWSNGCAISPAMTRSRCSRIPARRANMPVCWRFAATIKRAANRIARCA